MIKQAWEAPEIHELFIIRFCTRHGVRMERSQTIQFNRLDGERELTGIEWRCPRWFCPEAMLMGTRIHLTKALLVIAE
jgi:hypothetical protein